MLGNVGLNLLVPQFPHQWSGRDEPSPSGKRFGVCALASTSTGYGSGLRLQGLAGPTEHQARAEHREQCWGGIYIGQSLIPAPVLHLLMVKQPASPGLSLFVLGFLVPVQNRALAMGRRPKAQPGRGEGPAPVTVACPPLSFVPVGVAPLNAMSVLSFLFIFLSVR